jgi:hypothetical protein
MKKKHLVGTIGGKITPEIAATARDEALIRWLWGKKKKSTPK